MQLIKITNNCNCVIICHLIWKSLLLSLQSMWRLICFPLFPKFSFQPHPPPKFTIFPKKLLKKSIVFQNWRDHAFNYGPHNCTNYRLASYLYFLVNFVTFVADYFILTNANNDIVTWPSSPSSS